MEHIIAVGDWGFPFDLLDVQFMVKVYLDRCKMTELRFQNNLPSRDWAEQFEKRASVDEPTVNEYFNNLGETLKDIPPENIFNYDETNLSDDPGVKKCIFKREKNILSESRIAQKPLSHSCPADLQQPKCFHLMWCTRLSVFVKTVFMEDQQVLDITEAKVAGLTVFVPLIGLRQHFCLLQGNFLAPRSSLGTTCPVTSLLKFCNLPHAMT